MKKEQVLTQICDKGLVAVVRAESQDQAKRIAEACLKGGVAALEITFTVPGAHKVIEALAEEYPNGEIILGAGTVMDPPTARIAMLAGAQYIVSPYLDFDTIKMCNRYRVPIMPGCMSIREVVQAMEAGADIIKLFPAGTFGPSGIKNIRGPIPQAQIMPTGGVSVANAHEWISAGAVALGAGSALVGGAKTGDYDLITDTAKRFVEAINSARGK